MATAPVHMPELVRATSARQVRLICGIILFAYVVSHFLNHALGNISVDAMEVGVYYHTLFWQFLPVAIVFYTAALTHMGLGIYALYQRRQFRWRTVEPLQLVLGLSIPALVMGHVIGVRLGYTLYDHQKLYPQELYLFFVAAPGRLWQMTILLLIAWVHGCIGIFFWLRLKPFFTRAAPYLLAAAVLIPTLALLGIYQGGRSVAIESDDGEWRTHNLTRRQVGTVAEGNTLDRIAGGLTHRLFRSAGTGAGGTRRAGLARAARRHDRAVLRQRQDGAGPQGSLGAGSEPAPQRAACQHLRRPRPLLDLPHPHHRRS
ncbi:hypothetical protein ABIA41_003862 [Bradyrhizobium sp. USDA 313]